jgi:hypothetical protein
MAGIRLFDVHYGWEDCVSMGLGALIVLTSWMTNDVVRPNCGGQRHNSRHRRARPRCIRGCGLASLGGEP